jgi:toxin ParE1/3/4
VKPVLIRPSADRDMDEIFAWIAQDDPSAAERVIGRIFDAAKSLAGFPEKGRRRPEIGPDARSLVVGRYIVLYRVERIVWSYCASSMAHAI